MYFPREAARLVQQALEALPVVVLTGPRQSGKTTLLREDPALVGRRYRTLDDPAVLAAARADPDSLLEDAAPITIDEAQRCPELLLAVKRAVDRKRTPGRFLLSGSASFSLLEGVTETLAGRALYLDLHPFHRREIAGRTLEPAFLARFFESPDDTPLPKDVESVRPSEILRGGFPPAVASREPDLWFRGYVQTYLERDVRDLTQVADLASFRALLRLAALRTGQVLNQSEVGRDAKLPTTTTARYLSVLEASFAIRRLAPFLRSRSSRVLKSPKLYMSDSGLAAHLAGVDDLSVTADEPLRGALFETWAAQNLAALAAVHLPRAELLYWHVQGRMEVDFVLAAPKSCMAIEVKAASRFESRDLASLCAFADRTQGMRAAVLAYNGTEAVRLGDRLWALPLALLLS